jgi:DNA repair exonuclease SbcCD ATPase subunit
MKFNYVSFKNFLSFGDELSTIQLSDPGITLLVGTNEKDGGGNGAGKSTAIVESIVYGLFGQTTKELRAEQVVNNKTKCDCYVEVSFDINQDNYIIRRYRQHSEFGNKLVFEKNSVDVSKEKVRDTQEFIESIIQIGFKSFVLSIVLSQEKIANFAETDPTERKKIIENLLMFDFISKYHKNAKEILRIINPKLDMLNLSLNEKRETINTLSTNLLSYVDNWEATEKTKKERIKYLNKQVSDWAHLDLEKELSIRNQIKQKIREKEILESKKENVEEVAFNAKANIKKDNAELKSKNGDVDEVNKNPDVCPVCGTKLKEEALRDYINKIVSERDALSDDIDSQQKLLEENTEEVSNLIKKIAIKATEISTLNSLIAAEIKDEDIANIKEKIMKAENEIFVLSPQIDKNIEEDEYVKSTQKKIDDLKLEAKDIKQKLLKLEEEKTYYDWWKDALSNSSNSVKSFCVNHVLKSFNKYINYYLNFFNYDMSYSLDVELQDTIVKDGEPITFSQLSGGEKRSVEISLVFALYEIVKLKLADNINIIVLDELLSRHLDEVRINGALEILNELKGRDLSIFVIDHKSLIKESLDCKMLNIIKNKEGFSNLEIVE